MNPCIWHYIIAFEKAMKRSLNHNQLECLACDGMQKCFNKRFSLPDFCPYFPQCSTTGNRYFLDSLCSKDYESCPTFKRKNL